MSNLDEFVRDRAPTWTELEQLVDARGQLVRAGSAPTACAASARATARPRPTSRSRAGAFPAIRSSRGSNGSCSAAGKACTTRRRSRDRRARVRRRTATGDASASARRCSLIAFLCLAVPDAARRATGRGAIPGPASGLVPSQYQSVTAAAHAGQEPRRLRRRGVGDGVADLHEQHRRDVPRVRGRIAARPRHAVRACCRTACCSAWSRGSRSAPATAARSSSSSPRTACSS